LQDPTRSGSVAAAGRALAAIFRKNALEYIRYPANMVFGLFMPILWFIPTYFLIVSFAPEGSSAGLEAWIGRSDFFSYLPVGLVVSYVIMTIFWNIGFALKRLMDIGVLETLWSCPVRRSIFIVGESLFSMARMLVEVVIVMVVYRFAFGLRLPAGFTSVLPLFVPFVLLMYGFGIGFAAIVLLVKDANTMVDTSSFLMQGLTGTQNPPQVLPRFLLAIAMAIPVTYFIDLIRFETLEIVPLVAPAVERLVVFAAAALVPLAGLLFFSWVDRRVRTTGTIHVH
jgi:ABC-2 type transport system permease protein